MSDVSAYDDDEIVPVSLGSPSVDQDAAKGFLSQHRARADKSGAQFDAIMKQRSEAVAAAKTQLDETIAQMRQRHEGGGGLGAVNLPLLSLAAGLLSPAPPGTVSNFGQELSRGLGSMGTTIRATRMNDTEFLRGISDLQRKSAEMADKPLADAQTAEMRKQIASEGAAAGIERALVKANANAPGATPAKLKEFAEWQKDPQHAGKTYADFLKWRADELGADKTPALLREYAEWKKAPGNEARPISDFYAEKAKVQASGKAVGTSQGEAAQTIPNLDATVEQMTSTIDKLKKHPGFEKAVGLLSPLPNIPGGDSADFNAMLEQLKGQAFLNQFDKLRGAGAITETEGKKATDALAALSTSQSKKQFREQLDVALDILKKGQNVVRQKAGAPQLESKPPVPDAKKAPDGKWYVEKDGKFFEVRP